VTDSGNIYFSMKAMNVTTMLVSCSSKN
jgi:hypothetical protein